MSEIDAHAVISPRASIGPGSRIGPFAVVGDDVELGENSILDAHATIHGPARLGRENHICSFCVLGGDPQDYTYSGESVALEIGEANLFREFVSISRGTKKGGGTTRIGDHNFFMAYAHVGHDCQVGSHTLFINGATLAGHVTVEDYATLGAFSPVQQFCRVGRHSYVGALTAVTQDVPPYSKVSMPRNNRCYGVNAIGLERRGFTKERIAPIERAYRLLLRSKLNTTQALARIRETLNGSEDVAALIEFIESAEHGLIKK